MATRLYGQASSTPSVVPATLQGGWVRSADNRIRAMRTSKAATTETNTTTITSGANNNSCAYQLVSPPMEAQTIPAGTVTIISRGRELAGTDNVNKRWRMIYVLDADGVTVVGTLVTFAATASTTELPTTAAGQVLAVNAGTNSIAVPDGSVLVAEIGYGLSSTGTTPQADCVIGGSGTDHTTTEGDTTGTVPWIEFSQNITFKPVRESHLSEGSGTRSFPDAVVPYAGGKLVIQAIAESGTGSHTFTPSGGGLTYNSQTNLNSGDASHTHVQTWTADTSDATPVTVQIVGGALNWTAHIWADPGSGVGGVATANALTASETRVGANSHMYYALGDWNAGALGSPAWTPDGVTEPESQQGTSATYVYGTDQDSGAAGTSSTGISSPSYGTPTVAVIEITQGAATPSGASLDSTTASDAPAGQKQASRAAADATAPADRPIGGKQATRTASDATPPADRPAGAKVAVKSSASATAPGDRPVGVRVRNIIESAAPGDALTGRKVASGATVESATAGARPAGVKSVTRSTAASVIPADRPLGVHTAVRSVTDATTPSDRPLLRKQTSAATADASTPVTSSAASKVVAGSAQDATTPTDRPTTGLSFTHPAATSTTPQDSLTGRKVAVRTQTEVALTADRPGAANKSASAFSADAATVADRVTVRKIAVGATLESVRPTSASAAKRVAAGSSRVSTAPGDAISARKLATGSTRTSATPSDVPFHLTVFRNITINHGSLASTGISGILRRYRDGAASSPMIPGSVKPRLSGRLRRRGNP